MSFLFNKPNPKEQQRQNQRALRQTERELQKDRWDLDRQEKQLEVDIRKMAKQGNKDGCVVLAKQLVNLRKQRTRSYGMSAKVSGVNAQSKAMNSNMKMAQVMKTTTDTMTSMNKQINPMQVAKTMQEFEKANAKMEMSEEMINDTLDGMLDEDGDEEEQDRIVSQVMDELGIELSGKLSEAPSAHKGMLGESSKTGTKLSDADVERMLQNLKA